MHRIIPATMATQHPDNASAPYWETDGDGYVSTGEEIEECYRSFRDLDCQEFMWDWEGKYVDEGVADKLFEDYYDYFRKVQLGKDKFLTFRIPNIWQERGYGLARAIMGILTAESFARDLGFHTPPLFEVILPMTDKAEKIIHIQKIFSELAVSKCRIFGEVCRYDYLNVIPLIEGVENLIECRKILDPYLKQHIKLYKRKPHYLRIHIARSDPALNSGLIAAVVAGKAALSEYYCFGHDHGIDIHPAIGAGSLPFRGGLAPTRVKEFIREYPGMKTAYIQSAFRYDYPLSQVKSAIKKLNTELARHAPEIYTQKQLKEITAIARIAEKPYQDTIERIAPAINQIAHEVPSRRARKLHIGLFGYSRMTGKVKLPRAIPFTAALYSLGVPPELIGTGRALKAIQDAKLALEDYYRNFRLDVLQAGKYLCKDNLARLVKKNAAWKAVEEDVRILERAFGVELGPHSTAERVHEGLARSIFGLWRERKPISHGIIAGGKIRQSLG